MSSIHAININDDIDMNPYINLLAAIFEQARVDWIDGWTKISNIKYYDKTVYNDNRKYLKTLEKDSDEYIELNKELKIYEVAIKNINTVNAFLKSEWLELICVCYNLDWESIISEFNKIKNKIIKVQV